MVKYAHNLAQPASATSIADVLKAVKQPMTYDQAANRAADMRARGVAYNEIEEFLKNEGYVSTKTRRPISAVGIRQMVMKLEARRQKPREPIMLTNGDKSVIHVVEQVLAMQIATTDKLKMIQALLS